MHKEISPSACLVLFLIICNGFDSLVWFGRPAGGGETPKDSFFRGAAVFFFLFLQLLGYCSGKKDFTRSPWTHDV